MSDHHALLFLRFEGPLQSWGSRSRWDVRDSADEPTKSAVVGILGCALGYGVYDPRLELLDRDLTMAVRIEHQGSQMTDFQTVTGRMQMASGDWRGTHDTPSTIVSPRTYLQDSAFLIALDGDAELVGRCAEAMQSPAWPVFLGRKACIPTRPVYDGLSWGYSSLRDAMNRHRWRSDAHQWLGSPLPARLKCVIEDPDGNSTRYDCMRVNPARMYAWRKVAVEWVDFPGIDDDAGGGE